MSVKRFLFTCTGLFLSSAHAQTSIHDMPDHLRESIEWVWNNRIVPRSEQAPIGEGSTVRKNLIFDQIHAAEGSLNYVVRWQSDLALSATQRDQMQTMIHRQINNWTRHLTGFEGWPYEEITVKIVGWAVDDAALIQNARTGETIYTEYTYDAVHDQDPGVPANLPKAPDACSRFEHFSNSAYTYEKCPQGPEGRFDMYLWGTATWRGGAGGDWGQRMAETVYLNGLNTDQVTILEHEIGHGFGITDFYQASERPPAGFPIPLIMWAGNSATITEWDAWMLRYIWWKLKNDTLRFPPREPQSSSSMSSSSSQQSSSSSEVTTFIAQQKGKVNLEIHSINGHLMIRDAYAPVDITDLQGRKIQTLQPGSSGQASIALITLPRGVILVRTRNIQGLPVIRTFYNP